MGINKEIAVKLLIYQNHTDEELYCLLKQENVSIEEVCDSSIDFPFLSGDYKSALTKIGKRLKRYASNLEKMGLLEEKEEDADLFIIKRPYHSLTKEELKKRLIMAVDFIQNGVLTVDGQKRDFDILDYHYFLGLDYEDALDLSMEIYRESYNILNKFLDKFITYAIETGNRNRTEENLKAIKYKYKLNKEDECYLEITDEDKSNVIKFLKNNNVELLENTYMLALRRYAQGTLFDIQTELASDDDKQIRKAKTL